MMAKLVQILFFVFTGIALLWFGYALFFAIPGGLPLPVFRHKRHKRRKPRSEGIPGGPRTCPVCSALLEKGERVKSAVFPAMGGAERLMHIAGCVYCLERERRRSCPVCGAVLDSGDFLVARLYEKPVRSHVHVLGCSRCKKSGKKY
ncbi:MAG: hypothetical protein LBB82_04060 [Treponema sp.]|jgi:hypothetical protein|nr:hypothetical protein [Treponema sp.]